MSALSLLATLLQQRCSSQIPLGPERDSYVTKLELSIRGTIQFTLHNSTTNSNTEWLFEPNSSSTDEEPTYIVKQLSGNGAGTEIVMSESGIYSILFGVEVEPK